MWLARSSEVSIKLRYLWIEVLNYILLKGMIFWKGISNFYLKLKDEDFYHFETAILRISITIRTI